MSIKVTKNNFSNIVYNKEKPVLLIFTSKENENSKKQDYFLNLFSYEHPDVIIGNVDADRELDLTTMYGVSTVPSVKVFKHGKCTASAAGLQDKLHLHKLLVQ